MKAGEEVTVWTPNRLARRRIAGAPCGICGLRMFMSEIIAITQEGEGTDFTHPQCLAMNLEQPDAEREKSAPSADEIVTEGETND